VIDGALKKLKGLPSALLVTDENDGFARRTRTMAAS
jgi:hypothetical protein